ncbi:ribose-phosphate diphosphokinase, partial [Candidatus Peregrinibacteria bacterium]|nr:ribose-phosphate diphosphokinase [Candidatus Peregrinibacteria bacterium]
GAKDAKKFADILGATLAIIHKSRPAPNRSHVTHVVGEVKGRTCIIYDDMIDTGGSVMGAAKALRSMGSNKDVYLAATHAVFSDPAAKNLANMDFREIVVTNSIPISKNKRFRGLKILSVAPLLARIIRSIHEDKSVTKTLTK